MNRPNILWICTDQQRFDTLGCYGNPFVATPNIDRLARNGVLFEQAYCQSPVCTPSRASFLTGRYPRTTRCRQNGQNIPEDEVLVTRLLADAGYICGLAGKLHISACMPKAAPGMERRINDGYAEFHWSHHPMPDWPTNEYIHWLRERGQTFAPKPFEGSKYVRVGPEAQYHQTTWCAEKAIQFIRANRERPKFKRPWLFSVNMFDPHHPFDPPESHLRRYLDKLEQLPLPNYTAGELDGKTFFQKTDHEGAYGNPDLFPFSQMNERDHRLLTVAYWAMIDLIDEQVGRMIAALEETGQLEETIIIFMSDHGELLGDHGLYLKGPHFYDPCVHVPLIISHPTLIRGGRRIGKLVELTDLAPTLLEAAGLPLYEGMQGRSLWPVLAECAADYEYRSSVYCEHYNASSKQRGKGGFATMVRTERYKIVVYHRENEGELYDLRNDPKETHNLWNDEAHRDVKLDMYRRLCDRMAETVDPLPLRQSGW